MINMLWAVLVRDHIQEHVGNASPNVEILRK